jgi:hypothetical protein
VSARASVRVGVSAGMGMKVSVGVADLGRLCLVGGFVRERWWPLVGERR